MRTRRRRWSAIWRGLLTLKLGRREKARKDLEEAIKINPGFDLARRNLSDLAEKPQPTP